MNNNLARRFWTPLARNVLVPILGPIVQNAFNDVNSTNTYSVATAVSSGSSIKISGTYNYISGSNVGITGIGIPANTSVKASSVSNGVSTLTLSNAVSSGGVAEDSLVTISSYIPAQVFIPAGYTSSLGEIAALSDNQFFMTILMTNQSSVAPMGYYPMNLGVGFYENIVNYLNNNVENYVFSNPEGITSHTANEAITIAVAPKTSAYNLNINDPLDADMSLVKSGVVINPSNTKAVMESAVVLQAYQALRGYKF